jgi:predicted HTH domain antitoxin
MTLEIPDEVLHSLKLPPGEVEDELRKELALALYARGVLSGGKARRLANLSRRDFEELLGTRRITRHYGEEDLAEDLAYARTP